MSSEESKIRDKLSAHLNLLEPGLQLIKAEQFLPNFQGTRGFVDLFAQDKTGKYVLIELKRSASASRQAIHEVLKYLEAVKLNFSARDSEIRIFIVSTEWSELLVPFSSFVKRVSCQVTGYVLELAEDNTPIGATIVTPIDLIEDRLFAPWHELNLYESVISLEEGILSYEQSCKIKGINDFILVLMTPSPEHHKRSVDSTRAYLSKLSKLPAASVDQNTDDLAVKMPEYKFLLYYATLFIPENQCLSAICNLVSIEVFKEFESELLETSVEERLYALHNKIHEIEPIPKRDLYEIGYSSKFGDKLLDNEGWTIKGIKRYGTLKSNNVLTDESIINELRGQSGEAHQVYHKLFSPNNKSELVEVRAGVKRCLRDNILWRNQILRCLDDFLPPNPSTVAELWIFNPSNLCLSLYQSLSQEDGARYLPGYILNFTIEGQSIGVIFGVMWPTGSAPSFSALINTYFEGLPGLLLQNLTWGGYLVKDLEISEYLGMTYKTFKCEVNGKNRDYWHLTETGWKTHESIHIHSGFSNFIQNNPEFISDLVNFYSSNWDGVVWFHDPSENIQFLT